MPFESDQAVDLDPNTIEDLTILKGAAATALYGSRAANGVILVTTKSGRKGSAPQIDYSFKTSVDQMIEPPSQKEFAMGEMIFKTGEQFGTPTYYDGDILKSQRSWGPRIADVPGTKYVDRYQDYHTGTRYDNKLSISGAGDKTNYFINIGNLTANGMLDPQKYNKSDIFAKVKIDVTKWLSTNFSMNYIHSQKEGINEGDFSTYPQLMYMKPTTYDYNPIYDAAGVMRTNFNSFVNAAWLLKNNSNEEVKERFLPTFGFESKFLKDFTLLGRGGIDYTTIRNTSYTEMDTSRPDLVGQYGMNWGQYMNLNADVMLSYKKRLYKDLISIDAMAGYNVYTERADGSSADGSNFVLQGYPSFANCQVINYSASDGSMYRKMGVYGQAVVGFKDILYYTYTARNDWSSMLALDNNSYFYDSNSLSYIFSKNLNVPAITFGKLRASYASVGSDRGAGNTKEVYSAVLGTGPGGIRFPYNGISAFAPSENAANPNIMPEISKEFEVGLEMKFLKNRLGFEFAYYDKNSHNQIMSASLTSSTGYSSATMNIGEITNKGYELTVNATPVKTKDFTWNVGLNWSTNESLVVKMAPEMTVITLPGGIEIRTGQPAPIIALDYYIKDDQGREIIVDDPTLQTYGYPLRADNYKGKERISGKVEPDWFGGISTQFTYKAFSLYAFMDMRAGGYQNNATEQYLLSRGLSIITADRPLDDKIILPGVKGHVVTTDGIKTLVTTDTPNDVAVSYNRYIANGGYGAALFNEKYRLQKSDYVRLRDLSVAYKLPKDILDKTKFVKGLTVTVTGNNIWRKYDKNYTGPDPEYSTAGSGNAQGLNFMMLTSYASYTFGLNLTF
jgi:TonB-linked SusC/RagA family outer membrane protein